VPTDTTSWNLESTSDVPKPGHTQGVTLTQTSGASSSTAASSNVVPVIIESTTEITIRGTQEVKVSVPLNISDEETKRANILANRESLKVESSASQSGL
jgi:hypothetical protein